MWFGATYKMSTIHGEASMSTRCQRNFVLKILLIKALLDFFKLFPRDIIGPYFNSTNNIVDLKYQRGIS